MPCVAQASREAAGIKGGHSKRSEERRSQPPLQKPIIIGVTGGIASGKSTVAKMIAGRGILHLDADKIVHDLMKNDRDMIAEITAAFPKAASKGGIDRAALATEISKNPKALSALEAIIHPRVRAHEEGAIMAARRNHLRAVVLDVPLLFETDADQLCDIVIVAHAPIHHRRARAFSRPGMSEEKWQRLFDRQLPDHVRNHAADIVIPTAIGKAATRRQILALMKAWGL